MSQQGPGSPGSGGNRLRNGAPTAGGSWSPLPPHLFNRPPSPYVVPGGTSPAVNMFVGAPRVPPPYIPCPRPRWPSPGGPSSPRVASPLPWHPHIMIPGHQASPPPPQRLGSPGPFPGMVGPRPFRMPMHPPSPAPVRYGSPDIFRPGYYSPDFGPPQRDYEYVGVPLEPPPPLPLHYRGAYDEDEQDDGPSTAEIIANQSQDYIDEKLAEYQMTIYQLQVEETYYSINDEYERFIINLENSYSDDSMP